MVGIKVKKISMENCITTVFPFFHCRRKHKHIVDICWLSSKQCELQGWMHFSIVDVFLENHEKQYVNFCVHIDVNVDNWLKLRPYGHSPHLKLWIDGGFHIESVKSAIDLGAVMSKTSWKRSYEEYEWQNSSRKKARYGLSMFDERFRPMHLINKE